MAMASPSSVSSKCSRLSTRQRTSTSCGTDSDRETTASSSTTGSRPSTGDHILTWYIPKHIAGPGGGGTPFATSRINDSEPNEMNNKQMKSPLHDDSKDLWRLKYSDEKISSLPFPPPFKPKIHRHRASHENNLTQIFDTSHYPFGWLYSRYSIPVGQPILVPFRGWNYPLPSFYPNSIDNLRDPFLGPPPQSMFAHVGGNQRQHFTVAPDWRRIKRKKY